MHRLEVLAGHIAPTYWGRSAAEAAAYRAELLRCREAIRAFILEENCGPILVRLAWHDSGTFDASVTSWPTCGGANGSIRFEQELKHGANAGLAKGIAFLREFTEAHPTLSWADIIQLASATAIECMGGPKIPVKYGRLDADRCPAEGNLPDAKPPFGTGHPTAAAHLRAIFYRMGFDDREIVALSGAHTLGRAFKERSGVVENGYGAAGATAYTKPECRPRADGEEGVGMPGGQSWVADWLTFNNAYFQYLRRGPQPGLLWLPTDAALHDDAAFRPHFERYARDEAAFFRDYSAAHARLSALGSKFDPPEGIAL
jgi:L-ascorbate peroxidase